MPKVKYVFYFVIFGIIYKLCLKGLDWGVKTLFPNLDWLGKFIPVIILFILVVNSRRLKTLFKFI
ncbi:hypothetical protein AN960_10015 [Bacillus sp. FJAT-25509]|nr:hypothetical protein AN960_10015 [Bacillus sp. FJAT-25509]